MESSIKLLIETNLEESLPIALIVEFEICAVVSPFILLMEIERPTAASPPYSTAPAQLFKVSSLFATTETLFSASIVLSNTFESVSPVNSL